MEYGPAKSPRSVMAVLVSLWLGAATAAHAEHSSGFSHFGAEVPGSAEPTSRAVPNDGRSLTLRTAPIGNAPTSPEARTDTDYRITGVAVAKSVSAVAPALPLTADFAGGYNAPIRNTVPLPLSPRGGFIGLSRVPRGALSAEAASP